MSDVMLIGILRMPIDFGHDPLGFYQFVGNARIAADRIEADEKRIAELEARIASQVVTQERHMPLLQENLGLKAEVKLLREAIAESCDEARSDRMDCPRSARLEVEVKRLRKEVFEAGERERAIKIKHCPHRHLGDWCVCGWMPNP